MRLVFAGTPDAAVPSLRALAPEHDVRAVITRPDAPQGRKRTLTASPVAQAAEDLGLPLIKTARLDDEATARVRAEEPDLGVIVAYGGLVREPLLSAPRLGWINLHFSLLPRWRGAAPVQRSLIAGEPVTGVSVFQLVPELDAGDLFAQRDWEVPADTTAGEALRALATMGAQVLTEVVDELEAGRAVAHAQTGEPTYAAKLTLADGRLDWSHSAEQVAARVRGTSPEPGAHTTVSGERFKIRAARVAPTGDSLPPGRIALQDGHVVVGTGAGALELLRVQPAGKSEMSAADWWRGNRAEIVEAGS